LDAVDDPINEDDGWTNRIIIVPPVLSKSLEGEDPLDPVLAIRKLRHERLQKQLFLAQKNASLRSGARGLQARKELKVVEAKVDVSLERCVLESTVAEIRRFLITGSG
jgi:hypothetical protein